MRRQTNKTGRYKFQIPFDEETERFLFQLGRGANQYVRSVLLKHRNEIGVAKVEGLKKGLKDEDIYQISLKMADISISIDRDVLEIALNALNNNMETDDLPIDSILLLVEERRRMP